MGDYLIDELLRLIIAFRIDQQSPILPDFALYTLRRIIEREKIMSKFKNVHFIFAFFVDDIEATKETEDDEEQEQPLVSIITIYGHIFFANLKSIRIYKIDSILFFFF